MNRPLPDPEYNHFEADLTPTTVYSAASVGDDRLRLSERGNEAEAWIEATPDAFVDVRI